MALAPRVAGQVRQVHARDNQPVKAGDLLVVMDPRDFEVQVTQKKAALAAAEGQSRPGGERSGVQPVAAGKRRWQLCQGCPARAGQDCFRQTRGSGLTLSPRGLAAFVQQLAATKAALAAHTDPVTATMRAYELTYDRVLQQARLWAFVDNFRLFGLLCLVCLPMVFRFKRIQRRARAPDGAP